MFDELECSALEARWDRYSLLLYQIDHIPIDKFVKINDEISTRSNGLKVFKNGQDVFGQMCFQIEL